MADLIFFFGSLVFIFALIPSLFSEDKPNTITSSLTCIVLCIFSVTYAYTGFPLAGTITFVTAFLWGILAIQGEKNVRQP